MSQIWWSLDPGRSSGVGVWRGSELIHGRLLGNTTTGDLATAHGRVVREARELAALWRPAELVAEIPHVYGQRATDPADLVALARLLGRVEEALGLAAVVVWPAEWKGQVPKDGRDIIGRRVAQALTPEEAGRLAPCLPSLRHNLTDGVGLGLARLGRLPGGKWPAGRL